MAPNSISKCEKCKNNVNLRTQKHICCEGECRKIFHIPDCAGISEERYHEILNNSELSFLCDQCKKKKEEKRRSTLLVNASNIQSSSNVTPETNAQKKITSDKMDRIYEEVKKSNKIQLEMQKTLNDLHKTMEDYKQIIDNLTEENIELRNLNHVLTTRIGKVEYTMDCFEQKTLNRNLIISGIPEKENENLKSIITKMCSAININAIDTDIKNIERLKTHSENSGMPKSVIIEFNNIRVRDEMLKKKKEKLSTSNIMHDIVKNSSDDRPIYITEEITKYRRYLFKIARDIKREKRIEFAWVKNGELFVKKNKDSKAVKIKFQEQLLNF